MRNLLIGAFILVCVNLNAQEVSTYTYHNQLQLDLYASASSSNDRPLVLFIHGGGFSGGARDSENVQAFCMSLAKRDIVVASISYRLLMKDRGFGCDIPAKEKINTFLQAGIDGAYATAFLLSRSEELGINPNKIILAGSSAGAEAILHLAFWDKTRTDAGKGILPENFTYAGAISLAGAIYDLDLITPANAIPLMLVHGTCDKLVPYASAAHHYCDEKDAGYLMLHGAGSIAERYQALGASYSLYTVCGGGHKWASIPMNDMRSEIDGFIAQGAMGNHRQVHEWQPSTSSCDYPGASVCAND